MTKPPKSRLLRMTRVLQALLLLTTVDTAVVLIANLASISTIDRLIGAGYDRMPFSELPPHLPLRGASSLVFLGASVPVRGRLGDPGHRHRRADRRADRRDAAGSGVVGHPRTPGRRSLAGHRIDLGR